jgi:hypothetical protein
MKTKTPRDHLESYTDAAREIELAGVAIRVLEGLRSAEGARCIKLLEAMQRRQIPLLDAAAAKLGAPYPGKA